MGWKTIEICEADSIKLYLDNLLIYKNNVKHLISLENIDVLIIDNIRINISVQLMNKLSEFNILVIFCNNKHLPQCQIFPLSGNYKSLKIIEEQVKWDSNFKGKMWEQIIKNKIFNQINLLSFLGLNISEMPELLKDVKFNDISNREGHAAKIYFHSLFGKKFNRRDEENIINSLLNYGYSILLSYVSRSVVKKGLDLRISIYHKSFSNCYALACDLMEEFRPIVDYCVFKIYKEDKNFSLLKYKEELIKTFTKKIFINGKCEFINNAIDIFLDHFINSKKILNITIKYDQL